MHLILFPLQLSDFLSTFGSGVHCLFFPFHFPLLSSTGHFQGNHGREREGEGNPHCFHALALHCTTVISSTPPPSSASLRGGRQLTTLPRKRRKLGSNLAGTERGGEGRALQTSPSLLRRFYTQRNVYAARHRRGRGRTKKEKVL